MKRFSWMLAAIVVAVVVALVPTNPHKSLYKHTWLYETVYAKALVVLPTTTTRENFVLFSLYNTTVGESSHYKVLGIFDHFILLSANNR